MNRFFPVFSLRTCGLTYPRDQHSRPRPRPCVQDVVACLHAACRTTSDVLVSGPSTRKPTKGGKDGTSQTRRSQPRGGGRLIASSGDSGRSVSGGKRGGGGIIGQSDASVGEGEGAVDAIVLSPDLVADTALSSLNIHSGIMLLEDGIMHKLRASTAVSTAAKEASGGRRRSLGGGGASSGGGGRQGGGQSTSGEGQQNSWLQLSRLYAALGERDALVGVAARASRLEGTR